MVSADALTRAADPATLSFCVWECGRMELVRSLGMYVGLRRAKVLPPNVHQVIVI